MTRRTYLCVVHQDVLSGRWRAYLDQPATPSIHLLNEGREFDSPDAAYQAVRNELWLISDGESLVVYPMGPCLGWTRLWRASLRDQDQEERKISVTRLNQRVKRLIPYKVRENATIRARQVSPDPKVMEVDGGFVAVGDEHVDQHGHRFFNIYGARGTWAVRR